MKHTDLAWILFVLRRFNAADTKGRSAITGILSVLGIAFGVTVLIVILPKRRLKRLERQAASNLFIYFRKHKR